MMWTALAKANAKNFYRRVVGPKLYEKLEFRRHVGYWPDLGNPRTFNELVCARKFAEFPAAVELCDKLAVRDFVARKVGSKHLTRLYYSGALPEVADYDAFPSSFIIKANHGSGPTMRRIVWDKKAFSRDGFIDLGHRFLRRRAGYEVNEWWYTVIKPSLMVEELLVDCANRIPPDFKFYVFGGIVHFIQVIADRDGCTKSSIYDQQWRQQPFTRESFPGSVDMAPPPNLSEMIAVAEALGSSLDFVRVDLYSVQDRTVFGEMTLAPGAGWIRFKPAHYDEVLGRLWVEANIRKGV
jgi:hypothetical protein